MTPEALTVPALSQCTLALYYSHGVVAPCVCDRYFGAAGSRAQYAIDECGDLPCTNDTSITQAVHAAGAAGGDRGEIEHNVRVASRACPTLDSVRECHQRCQSSRRKRRIRLGLNPDHAGHNVCQVPVCDRT